MNANLIPLLAITTVVTLQWLRGLQPGQSGQPVLLMASGRPHDEPHDLWGASYNPEELRSPVAPDESEGAISPFLLIGFLASVMAIFMIVVVYFYHR